MAVPDTETFSMNDVLTEISGRYNLQDMITYRDTGKTDPLYYPYYLVSGSFYNATNSLINFRNYGGTKHNIPVPTVTGGSYVGRTYFTAEWSASLGASGYYIDCSTTSNFASNDIYDNVWVADTFKYVGSGLTANTDYYYRVRAYTSNGTSINSSVAKVKTCYWWYLPSLQELDDMYDNLRANSIGNFSDDYYWSSTEYTASQAYELTMYNAGYQGTNKSTTDHVRALRHFTSSYNYAVGDATGYGFISYKESTGDGYGTYKYYECLANDTDTDHAWSNIINSSVGSTSANRGQGYVNTAVIIAQSGHTDSAAKCAYDVTTN